MQNNVIKLKRPPT